MFQDFVLNIASDITAAIIITLFGILSIFFFYILDRQRMLKFFGINNNNPRITIFVSRLEIIPGGTTGFEPLTQGYFGPGIIRVEYKGGLLVREALRSRLLARLPQGFQEWLSTRSIALTDVEPTIDVSPKGSDEFPNDNLILLGTGIYNLGSKIYLGHPSSCFEYSKNEKGDRVFKLRTRGMEGVEIPGRSAGRELGIIQRINDHNCGRTIFICAGLGASASYGCVRFLMENWKTLQRNHKDNEFGICLAFSEQSYNSDAVTTPYKVYEFQNNRQ